MSEIISKKSPKAKGMIVDIEGVSYQVINGKLYRYADLTLDKGFKIVLGRIGSEELLKKLLNRLLGTRIMKLEYRNTEHPGMTEEERSSRFDVYCEDEDGTCFQVGMQNWSQDISIKEPSTILPWFCRTREGLHQEDSASVSGGLYHKIREQIPYISAPVFSDIS